MASKKTEETKPEETKPAQVTVGLYSITFAPVSRPKGQEGPLRGTAPEQMNVGLPNGGVVFMNANLETVAAPTEDDPKATRKAVPGDPGFPYAEALLDPAQAAEWAVQYGYHGLELKPIAKSALKRHPIHED